MTDLEVLNTAITTFTTEFDKKFREGMTKYPHPIFEKSGIDEAFPEAYDLIAYLTVARAQREKALELVNDLRNAFVGIYDDDPNAPVWDQLVSLLSPKPLAVKKLTQTELPL